MNCNGSPILLGSFRLPQATTLTKTPSQERRFWLSAAMTKFTTTGVSVSIDAGTGDDTVLNKYSSSVIIDGGDGDDYVSNYYDSDSVKIDTGDGNDYVSNYYDSNSVTIDTGAGNDTISLGSNATKTLIEYTAGDGDDTIEGFKDDDTLKISGGTYSKETVNNDMSCHGRQRINSAQERGKFVCSQHFGR